MDHTDAVTNSPRVSVAEDGKVSAGQLRAEWAVTPAHGQMSCDENTSRPPELLLTQWLQTPRRLTTRVRPQKTRLLWCEIHGSSPAPCCWGREGPVDAIWDKCSPMKHHVDTNTKSEFLLKGKMLGWCISLDVHRLPGGRKWNIQGRLPLQANLCLHFPLWGLSGARLDR